MPAQPSPARSTDAPDGTVSSVRGHARFADPEPELRRARQQIARGDNAWQGRLDHYESGQALLIELTGCVVIDSVVRPAQPLHFCHEVAWLDRSITRAALIQRLVALAHRDFEPVGTHLRDRGVELAGREDTIPVHF